MPFAATSRHRHGCAVAEASPATTNANVTNSFIHGLREGCVASCYEVSVLGAQAQSGARTRAFARRLDQIINVIRQSVYYVWCTVLGHDCATTCQHFQAAWPASNPIRAGIRATDSQFSSVQFSHFTVPPRAHPSAGSRPAPPLPV